MPRHATNNNDGLPGNRKSAGDRESTGRSGFRITYFTLAIITGAAIATPPAAATDLLPDSNIGAVTMIAAIAVLMLVLVIEIWRQTGKKAMPKSAPRPVTSGRKRRPRFY